MEIKCPGNKLILLLDSLDPDEFRSLRRGYEENPDVETLRRRIDAGFPNFSEKLREGLVKSALIEYHQRRNIYLTLAGYGRNLVKISETLGRHVENCRDIGGCFDRYMLYLEHCSREELELEAIGEKASSDVESENVLPESIRRLDLLKLDLLNP
ncbi:hypothetical protein GF386_00060 [Candidatus Pacearchaeota archaeon]|nr:hypothetical protein [Candidatus Pacearchaeota archaeon]MBD3282672.1 hypothetical protein [Candidatus Pacearchaeota archaeon]